MYLFNAFKKKTLLIAILFVSKPLSYNIAPYYVLWDVGQGQWLSRIDSFQCLHIDIGGERFPKTVKKDCAYQKHKWWVSHWDWDHYRFLRKIISLYAAKEHFFSREQVIFKTTNKTLKKNDQSKVVLIDNFLIPGDSTKKMEKKWTHKIYKPVYFFLLGHHGSNTSNHLPLLNQIKKELKQCLCSARKKKYGHPHPKVKKRLNVIRCPLICTQEWGNIRFRM